MNGLTPAVDYLKDGTNRAVNTKNAILFMVEANETINKKIKEIEQKAMEEVTKVEPSKFHFDINEVPRIVLQDKEKDER